MNQFWIGDWSGSWFKHLIFFFSFFFKTLAFESSGYLINALRKHALLQYILLFFLRCLSAFDLKSGFSTSFWASIDVPAFLHSQKFYNLKPFRIEVWIELHSNISTNTFSFAKPFFNLDVIIAACVCLIELLYSSAKGLTGTTGILISIKICHCHTVIEPVLNVFSTETIKGNITVTR